MSIKYESQITHSPILDFDYFPQRIKNDDAPVLVLTASTKEYRRLLSNFLHQVLQYKTSEIPVQLLICEDSITLEMFQKLSMARSRNYGVIVIASPDLAQSSGDLSYWIDEKSYTNII